MSTLFVQIMGQPIIHVHHANVRVEVVVMAASVLIIAALYFCNQRYFYQQPSARPTRTTDQHGAYTQMDTMISPKTCLKILKTGSLHENHWSANGCSLKKYKFMEQHVLFNSLKK